MKDLGYRLALDDYCDLPETRPRLDVAAVLQDITVGDDIKKALLDRPSRYRPIFEVVLDYESGTREQLEESCRHCGLHENFLPDLYLQSVRWVSDILAEVPVTA